MRYKENKIMKKNSTLLERLLEITEQEEPQILQELKEESLVTFYRVSLLGIFDSMENFAKSAKVLVGKGTVLTPTPAIKILLNATVSLCASAEKIIEKIEAKEDEELAKQKNSATVQKEFVEKTEKKTKVSSVEHEKEEKESLKDPFNSLLKIFKKTDGGNN